MAAVGVGDVGCGFARKQGVWDIRILLVEDDLELCRLMEFQLKQEGYLTESCHDGQDALLYLRLQAYDLVILDRMLPGMDGIQILRHIRKDKIATPVIMLTALGKLEDKIDGLDAGADDYIVKPFAAEELFARIRALERRPALLRLNKEVAFRDITLDLSSRTLRREGKAVELSKKEMDLLECFIRNKGQTLTRELLLNRVWGPESSVEDGNLDNYIYFLRRRLRQVGSQVAIRTVRSVGYCLEE